MSLPGQRGLYFQVHSFGIKIEAKRMGHEEAACPRKNARGKKEKGSCLAEETSEDAVRRERRPRLRGSSPADSGEDWFNTQCRSCCD